MNLEEEFKLAKKLLNQKGKKKPFTKKTFIKKHTM